MCWGIKVSFMGLIIYYTGQFLNQEMLSEADIQLKTKIKIQEPRNALLILDEKTLKI